MTSISAVDQIAGFGFSIRLSIDPFSVVSIIDRNSFESISTGIKVKVMPGCNEQSPVPPTTSVDL